MVEMREISEALMKGDAEKVKNLTEKKLSEGASPLDILNNALIAGMDEVGKKFRTLEIFVPEVLVAARAMSFGVEALKPAWKGKEVKPLGTMVIGTVKGDLHDIGKNLVGMLMEGAGFQVIDLGIDVASEKFVEAVKSRKPNLLGLSALLTTTMPGMEEVIKTLETSGLRGKVKVMIGGGSISEKVQHYTGADAWGADAQSAVSLCNQWIKEAAR